MSGTLIRFGILAALVVAIVWHATGFAHGAGALAVGQCGAFGHAFDYTSSAAAERAAREKCQGECTVLPINRACAAFSVDVANPCGAFGYAVAPKIQNALNASMRNCYKYGGRDCVIRDWACDGTS